MSERKFNKLRTESHIDTDISQTIVRSKRDMMRGGEANTTRLKGPLFVISEVVEDPVRLPFEVAPPLLPLPPLLPRTIWAFCVPIG